MHTTKRILVTGASGFIGKALVTELSNRGRNVTAVLRTVDSGYHRIKYVSVPDIGPETNWQRALKDIDIVVHLAGRAHKGSEGKPEATRLHNRVNHLGTFQLASQSAQAGVKNFIYLSTAKVHGDETIPEAPFTVQSGFNPSDAYALSKCNAEVALRRIESETQLRVTVIRPPLVYGRGVKGNFQSLVALVKSGFPIPFGSLGGNFRSYISIENLTDFIMRCIDDPRALGKSFLISDGNSVSTMEIINNIAGALGLRARVLHLPPIVLHALGRLTGNYSSVKKLTSNFEIDISDATVGLGWSPVATMEQALHRMFACDDK